MRVLVACLLLVGCAAPTAVPEVGQRHTGPMVWTVDTGITPTVAGTESLPRERVVRCQFIADTVEVEWGGILGYEIVERCT
jgi:hypothetical protein